MSEWKVTRQALRSNSGHLRSAAKISMETVSHPLRRLLYPIKTFRSLLCCGWSGWNRTQSVSGQSLGLTPSEEVLF